MTIADYWGIEKYSPEWFDPLGVSLILVNSSKGAELLNQCQDLLVEERSKEESLCEQKRLSEPSQIPENRSLFWDNYRRFGFEYVIGDNNKK